jgi:hypothetical protein
MATVDDRVRSGAAFLDERYPEWVERIDLDELDMNDCKSCIVGQAVANYSTFFSDAEENCGLPGALGFNLDYTDDYDNWPDLEEAWRSYITARRAEVTA